MNHDKMKSLIFDQNILIYIHDVMYLKTHHEGFENSTTYQALFEKSRVTIFKYLKQTQQTLITFVLMLLILKRFNIQASILNYGIYLVVATIYGVLFVECFDDFKALLYQLKAKKAVQYALNHYNYEEYVVFLDSYLSEQSTKNHLKII